MVSLLQRAFTRPQRHASHYERVLGTSLELQVVATSLGAWQRAESAVLAEVDRLERILSSYSATSELSRWQVTYGVDVPSRRSWRKCSRSLTTGASARAAPFIHPPCR